MNIKKKKKGSMKADLNQMLINISQRTQQKERHLGWMFIMTKAKHIYLQFSGKENIFSDHS